MMESGGRLDRPGRLPGEGSPCHGVPIRGKNGGETWARAKYEFLARGSHPWKMEERLWENLKIKAVYTARSLKI